MYKEKLFKVIISFTGFLYKQYYNNVFHTHIQTHTVKLNKISVKKNLHGRQMQTRSEVVLYIIVIHTCMYNAVILQILVSLRIL